MKKRGISVLILAVTIVVMTILVGTTIGGISLAIDDARLRVFASDLNTIEDKIEEEYNLTGILPVHADKKTKEDILALVAVADRVELLAAMEENKDEDSIFYAIALEDLGITSSKRGVNDTQDDIYVVSEDHLKVYYIKGVKIGKKRYFSLSDKLTGLNDVEENEEEQIGTLSEQLKVVKRQKTWTNKIELEVHTLLQDNESIYVYLEGTSYNFNITAAIKDKGYVEISRASLGDRLNGVTGIKIEKRETQYIDSRLMDTQYVNIDNLDIDPPVITDSTFVLKNTSSEKSITSIAADNKSGIGEFKYQIVSRKVGEEIIKDNESSVSDDINATGDTRREISEYLRTFGKIAEGNKAVFPISAYHVRVIVSDRAGNYSDYKEYVLENLDRINEPVLVTGMTPVKWSSSQNKFIETTETDEEWYDYSPEKKQWANAITKNKAGQITGYYVWIPRYAYKIVPGSSTEEKANGGGHFEILFLLGDTDKYVNPLNAKIEDIPVEYIVHPAFKDGKLNNYQNGEWDEEIKGFWFAKYEAGYPSKGNNIPVTKSNYKYSVIGEYVVPKKEIEALGRPDEWKFADTITAWGVGDIKNTNNFRNAIDGRKNPNWGGNIPNITYPVFLANTSSYNYINASDMYTLSRSLNDDGNPYGFSKYDSDTHMIKNSEWGAVTYLAYSEYGVKNKRIKNNYANSFCKDGYKSLYAITAGGNNVGKDASYASVTADKLSYDNASQSTTGNVYGVYDMQGGAYEKTSSFINNGTSYLTTCMKAMTADEVTGSTLTKSTKYVTIYPHSSSDQGRKEDLGSLISIINISRVNWKENNYVYGDAIRETSYNTGSSFGSSPDSSSWYGYETGYPAECYPNIKRGGRGYDISKNSEAAVNGIFAFMRNKGDGSYMDSFRVAIIPKD